MGQIGREIKRLDVPEPKELPAIQPAKAPVKEPQKEPVRVR